MKIALTLVTILAVWPFSSTKKYPMTAGANVPAATGTVMIDKDKENGNTKVDVKVDHLADPSSLTPSASAYIVWVRPNGGDAVKQGALRVDKNLSGELKTQTVSKSFDVLITAENSESATFPSSVQVLSAHVN